MVCVENMLGGLVVSLWPASASCKATCEAVQVHKTLTPRHENDLGISEEFKDSMEKLGMYDKIEELMLYP